MVVAVTAGAAPQKCGSDAKTGGPAAAAQMFIVYSLEMKQCCIASQALHVLPCFRILVRAHVPARVYRRQRQF